MELSTATLLGAWVSIFLTICILSFLYEDNPVYKLAEHLFLGVSIAVSVVEAYYGTFKPNMLDPVGRAATAVASGSDPGWDAVSIIPLLLCGVLFLKLVPKLSWAARIPIAFLVAMFAGLKLTGEANANLMTQVAESMPNLGQLWVDHGLWDWSADGAGVISGLVLVFGLCACLLHFYFSAPHNRPLRVVSRFGVLMLMFGFGASFGYTVMGRISLAIGRAQELLGLDRSLEQNAIVHPRIATLASIVLLVGVLAVWKLRGGKPESDEATDR
jgi:hypothetical protein